MSYQPAIREEELKNRIAAWFFGKYDCTRIVGNIDFCVLPKRRDTCDLVCGRGKRDRQSDRQLQHAKSHTERLARRA